MNELKNNKIYKFLILIFIIISTVHIIYATVTMRGMYHDSAPFMLSILNNVSNNVLNITYDPHHPRFCILALLEAPSILSYYVLFIHNKFALMMIFSLSMFLFPLLVLLWNYNLSKKTQRLDIFFWSLFSYSLISISYSIYSVVENILGSMFHFVLWNYLAGKIDYNKKDIAFITFLIIVMFGTYEYVIFLGIIFFIASIMYAKREESIKNKIVKLYIGIGALAASIFDLIYALNVQGEKDDIIRFLNESYSVIPNITNLNFSISIITLIILFGFQFYKKDIKIKHIILILTIHVINLIRLLSISEISVNPYMENSLKISMCIFLPVCFIYILLFDYGKREQNYRKLQNYICIVLMCGIMHTAWQLVDTYYWDKNIRYMKDELNKTKNLLYITSENGDISNGFNNDLRRYIFCPVYSSTSILFSDTYEQKTLLLHYDEPGVPWFREWLYVPKGNKYHIVVPWTEINTKNKFWDLTKCADALQKYDKEHNINQDK